MRILWSLLIALVACGQPKNSPPRLSPTTPVSAPVADAATVENTVDAGSEPPGVELAIGGLELTLSRFDASIAISADGRWVAAISRPSRLVLVFDATTGKELRRWTLDAYTLHVFDDGRVLATGIDKAHQLAPDGTETILGDSGGSLAVSPDGGSFATVHRNVLAIYTGKDRTVLVPKLRSLRTMAFAPDGSRFCTIQNGSDEDIPSGPTVVTIYDRVATGWRKTAAHKLEGARQENDAMFLSREALLLDADVIDVRSGRAVATGNPSLRASSADGKVVLLGDGTGREFYSRITDGKLGPATLARRPALMARSGHAMAISSHMHVVWCTDTRCVVGPST